MTDHLIPLPKNFRYLNEFAPSSWAPNPSHARCATASMAMLAQIAYPGRWIPEELEHDLYVSIAGPDVASNPTGIPPQPLLDWMHKVDIGYIDMGPLLGKDELVAEIEAQNLQGVPQLVEILDMSQLHDAKTGAPLYTWAGGGANVAHYIVRVGYSDTDGYGWYMDPASPGFSQPVPISWFKAIIPAQIYAVYAIMPAGVPVPPAGFSYQTGVWPKPKPVFDAAKAESTLQSALLALDAARGALTNLTNDLDALKTEV